jgi:hypothetical protein
VDGGGETAELEVSELLIFSAWWRARFCWGFSILRCAKRGEKFPHCGELCGKDGLRTVGFWVTEILQV